MTAFCVTMHRVIWVCLVFSCIVNFLPSLLSCPGSSVGRVFCLFSRVSWVRVAPRAAPFSFEKCFVVVGVSLFVLHLPCTTGSLYNTYISLSSITCRICCGYGTSVVGKISCIMISDAFINYRTLCISSSLMSNGTV